jgi:hypothetical protein
MELALVAVLQFSEQPTVVVVDRVALPDLAGLFADCEPKASSSEQQRAVMAAERTFGSQAEAFLP